VSVVLVCGSRTWGLPLRIYHRLGQLADGTVIRHGGASRIDRETGAELSADMLADQAARSLGFTVEVFRPDYKRFGRAAPLRRNDRMLDEDPVPVLVIAFQRGCSSGTGYTIHGARERRIDVEVHRP